MEDSIKKYFKWYENNTICCAIIKNYTSDFVTNNLLVADYYKNGDFYAQNKRFIIKPSDIEITEDEFNFLTFKK